MIDPRITKLADVLINYSCSVQKGEKILIEAIDVPNEFTSECIRLAKKAGGIPLVKLSSNQIMRSMLLNGSEEGWNLIADGEKYLMEKVQCYIGARGNANVSELSDVPREKQKLFENTVLRRVHHEIRVKNTKWVVLRWPNPSMAQLAEMSTQAFEDFYFNVCTMDYKKMNEAMKPLIKRMDKTDKVRILGPKDTDITFSIKDIPTIPCAGNMNIPDGEIFTAPVKNSINGVIHYNAPTLYRGETHNDIRLEFRDGKIIAATSTSTEKLNEVLDSDEGARYIGEFAIGVNPFCTKAMKDILFDEKIGGSIHFTPGACYDEASNGNKSDVHWDMVMIQTPEYGGGEIYFDGELIRKDGQFVPKDLQALNPENLK